MCGPEGLEVGMPRGGAVNIPVSESKQHFKTTQCSRELTAIVRLASVVSLLFIRDESTKQIHIFREFPSTYFVDQALVPRVRE